MLWLLPTILIVILLAGNSQASNTASHKIVTINGRRVLVHIPENTSGKQVFYFHGNGAKIENISTDFLRLLDTSNQRAIIIIPQLDSNGFIPTADLKAIIDQLNIKAFGILAYSGGIKAAVQFLKYSFTRNVGLLDALYENTDIFRSFILNPETKTFTDVYGPSTKDLSLALKSQVSSDKAKFIESSVAHGAVPATYAVSVLNNFQ